MPGPHGFTVRRNIVRLRAPIAHEPKLALQSRPRARRTASTASHPNVRDDRYTPLLRDETAGFLDLICVGRREEYSLNADLAENSNLPGRATHTIAKASKLEPSSTRLAAISVRNPSETKS
jgi:hypothetical protein